MNIEFIQKVKNLADSGVGGEKTNAAKLLARLMKKHNITPEELEQDTKEELHKIRFRGKYEKQIVVQCVVKALGSEARGYFKSQAIMFYCTKLQYAEASALCEFYLRAIRKDLDTFINAFIHKNHLFPPTDDTKRDEKPLTPADIEEIKRTLQMMSAMDKHEYHKMITGGKNAK